jgi:hypothetical protein
VGAIAKQNFGLQADPTAQTLCPITAVIGTAWATRNMVSPITAS